MTDSFEASNLLGISNIPMRKPFQDHTIHDTTWLSNLQVPYFFLSVQKGIIRRKQIPCYMWTCLASIHFHAEL